MLMVKVAKRGTKQLIVALSKYTFSLTESAGVLMKIRNKQRMGSVYFTGITLTSLGTYIYSISEVQITLGGVTLQAGEFRFGLYDKAGNLLQEVQDDGHDIQFVNTYQEPMTPSEPSDIR